ncbi:hypothetical protein [Chromobacterium subtsugae]|uniref:hypothetical protein n=1 Tax=Chromobacterium subtsugae TaxID=251747 RepID=UPI000A41F5E3|nr:hypothetical protein [Chromobacterium subtsugae]
MSLRERLIESLGLICMPLLIFFHAMALMIKWASAIGPIQYVAAEKATAGVVFKFSSEESALAGKLSRLNCRVGSQPVGSFINLDDGLFWSGSIEEVGHEGRMFIYKADALENYVEEGRWLLPSSHNIIQKLTGEEAVQCRVVQGSYLHRPTASPAMIVPIKAISAIYGD